MDHATGELIGPTNSPVTGKGPETVTPQLRAPNSNRGVNGRLFYQIYWDNGKNTLFTPNELADIIRVLAPDLVLFNPYRKPGQLVMLLNGNVEVKVGYNRFVHISSPDPDTAQQVWQRINHVLTSEEGDE